MVNRTAIVLLVAITASAARAGQRSQSFDADPGWQAVHNRMLPDKRPAVTQDFGYSQTHFAGSAAAAAAAAAGEMGGTVQRASEPAFYADRIGPATLDQKLTASGTFAFTGTTAGGGAFFGFFNGSQPGGSGRPIGSLGLHFDCEKDGARLAVRLITAQNQSCGTFVTPFIPGKFRPTPIRNDGTRYSWTLEYDPAGAAGRGSFTFTIHGDSPTPEQIEKPDLPEAHLREARSRFPRTTTFTVELPEGYKRQNTTFDHFGLMNMMKPGGRASVYFDDLRYLDRSQDFSSDPKWDASGNRSTYEAKDVVGAHDFGFSNTSHAGGKPGEVGGTFWRTGKWGYYADAVGPLSLDDRLEARGKVVMTVGGPDGDMCFGWFRARRDGDGDGDGDDNTSPDKSGDFVGIHVGGPTRVGHYFVPAFAVSDKVRAIADKGPVLRPGRTYDWSLVYDPTGNNGNGSLTATLGDESVTYPLRPGVKAAARDFRLDRFGVLSIGPGGQVVKLYLDDLTYTAGR
jgi:hypothetical protein